MMIRATWTESSQNVEHQISILNDYVWQWNQTKSYGDFDGLGTGGAFTDNTSTMLAFDRALCSEIDFVVASAFNNEYDIARLDITGHTVFEVYINDRAIIVDPFYNPKITNQDGRLATFEELKNYKNNILQSARMTKGQLERYYNIFDPRKYQPPPKEAFAIDPNLRKTSFGAKKIMKKIITEENSSMPTMDKLLSFMQTNNINEWDHEYRKTIVTYHHNLILYRLYNKISHNNMVNTVHQVQDILLDGIKEKYSGLLWSKEYHTLWEARQYQLLGRFAKAQALLKQYLKQPQYAQYNAQIKHYLAQNKTLQAVASKINFPRFL